VDHVVWEGELAGSYAAEYTFGTATPVKRAINIKPGQNIRYVVPHTITAEKDVVLYMRVREPAEHVSIKIGNILTKRLRFVKPSEMIRIEVSTKELERIDGKTDKLEIHCERRQLRE
jgi:hypothetical protein